MISDVKRSLSQVGALVATIIACLPSIALAEEHRAAILTTEELRQRLADSHSRIRAWYVEYESTREFSAGKSSYLHRVVAAKSPDRFLHWNSHGSGWLDWRDDPSQQRLILTSNMAVSERPLHRSFMFLSSAPDVPLLGTSSREFLFMALGWWPFPKRPPPKLMGDVPCVLPAIARSPKYVVNPRQELVRNRWCHVLEYPGHDRLWLDCDHNCAVMAREVYDSEKEVLLERIEASGHREVQTGIWVPSEFRNMLFHADERAPQGVRGIKTLDSTLKVLEVRLNEQVENDLFHFELLPGSIQFSEDNLLKHENPGAAVYLNEVVDWIQRHVHYSATTVDNYDFTTESILENCIIGGGIVILLVVLLHKSRYAKMAPIKRCN